MQQAYQPGIEVSTVGRLVAPIETTPSDDILEGWVFKERCEALLIHPNTVR